ncbi:MAG: Hpt domain-containing protein [Coriobacteriia bacterium]|nr:Hpt domain-containing protein [Coriobacteriia bacterium]
MDDRSAWTRPFTVVPDPDLVDLVPTYLGRRHDDLAKLEAALAVADLETVRIIGHSMKGSGGGYGFDGLTTIGALLENAGRDGDPFAAKSATADLRDYLANVEVDYA